MRRSICCFALALAAVAGCTRHEKTVRYENPPLTIGPPSATSSADAAPAGPPSPSSSSSSPAPSGSPPPAHGH